MSGRDKAREKHISEIAAAVGVNPSALRFWEKKGLISFGRSDENNYRTAGLPQLLRAFDIVIFRSLGMTIDEIKSCLLADADEMPELLEAGAHRADEQIARLREALINLRKRRDAVLAVRGLAARGLRLVRAALPALSPLSYDNSEDIRLMMLAPEATGVVMRRGGVPEAVALGEPAEEEETDAAEGLLALDTDTQLPLNAEEFFAFADALGRRHGRLIGRYLATFSEGGARRDFYRATLELLS